MTDAPRVVKDRQAARLLVLDDDGCVLLIHCWDINDHSNTFWVTPGGGLDPDESFEDAVRREAFEELGLVIEDPGHEVHRRETILRFSEVEYHQHERYYCWSMERFEPVDRSHWTDIEHQSILGFRWWSVEELRSTQETVFPEELADVLDRI